MAEKDGDLVQLGASDATRRVLESLKNEGHIDTLLDGYRLGISVAIAFGKTPRRDQPNRKTMFQTSSVDDVQRSIRTTIIELFPEATEWPYRAAEDLAEQGVAIVGESMEGEEIWYGDLIDRIARANDSSVQRGEPETAVDAVR
jgi:hypothetical protein